MNAGVDRVRSLVDRRGQVANRDVAAALQVSPATAHRWLHALTIAGVLLREGAGRTARYRLRPLKRRFRLSGLQEDTAWGALATQIARIRPLGDDAAQTLRYAATEILNNAIDHSRGRTVTVTVEFGAGGATIVQIADDGVGVFHRLCADFGFGSAHDAIVQLEKGKLTSAPEQHSGEGLFFTSKAVSRFRLEGQGTAWIVDGVVGDSAIAPSPVLRGTQVTLELIPGHLPSLVEVFARFTDAETLRFNRTRTTIKLSTIGRALVSRSEARRVGEGLLKFEHVTLDFTGVDVAGQGFCDEIFRVFARQHPQVKLEPVGMNDAVAFMVARARAAAAGR
jgi:anti-sigma regulatory factor (Ser/Thr protein kinase)